MTQNIQVSEKFNNISFTQDNIINSIKAVSNYYSNKGIVFDNNLISELYNILKAFLINNKRYIFLQAPTGTGKSIIGLMLKECIRVLTNDEDYNSYYLTSTKVLQHQLESDLTKFGISNTVMLKGSDNYICNFLVDKHKNAFELGIIDKKGLDELITEAKFSNRECVGVNKNQLAESELFGKCYEMCNYRLERLRASEANCTIFNYNYFLSILPIVNNPFFSVRFLTICDEAHKISDILNGNFSIDITRLFINIISGKLKLISPYINSVNAVKVNQIKEILKKQSLFFSEPNEYVKNVYNNENSLKKFLDFLNGYLQMIIIVSNFFKEILAITNKNGDTYTRKELGKFMLLTKKESDKISYLIAELSTRYKDFYIENIPVSKAIYKFIVKDINEKHLFQNYFNPFISKGLFMSATMGNMNNMIEIMGLPKEECEIFTIESNFNFDSSPIYLVNSGLLTQKHIAKNMNNVLENTIEICRDLHPNDKGIIHTHTHFINEELQNLISKLPKELSDRFLFYKNSKEKEECLDIMKTHPAPYILTGPSLVEGLDLKNNLGRFNILIKVPYPPIDEYMTRKIKLYPSFYSDSTIKAIVQSIGRTNRNKDDFSIVYLMDTKFSTVIMDADNIIVNRLRKFNYKFKNDLFNSPQMENDNKSDDDIFDEVFNTT